MRRWAGKHGTEITVADHAAIRDEYDCDQCGQPIKERFQRTVIRIQRHPPAAQLGQHYIDPDPWRNLAEYDLHPKCEDAFVERIAAAVGIPDRPAHTPFPVTTLPL